MCLNARECVCLCLCIKEVMRNTIRNVLSVHKNTDYCIKTDTNLTQLILEPEMSNCADCGGKLKRAWNIPSNSKGSISIVYTQKGPKLAVLIGRKCTRCNYTYYLSYKKHTGRNDIRKLSFYGEYTENMLFHVSTATVFEAKLFEEYLSSMTRHGSGPQLFVDMYNLRFEAEINDIIASVSTTELGKRGWSGSIHMTMDRFMDAFLMYHLFCCVSFRLFEELVIYKDDDNNNKSTSFVSFSFFFPFLVSPLSFFFSS